MQTTAESQTATGILYARGFRASHIAERPEGIYTAWTDSNGERKISLRTPEGKTTVFGAEVSTAGTFTIHKPDPNSAFDMLHLAASRGADVAWVDDEIVESITAEA